MILTISELSHIFLSYITDGTGIYVDATAGNGNDSLAIAKMLKQDGILYCFDISETALINTKKLLDKNNMLNKNINIINDSHANIESYIKPNEEITAALFNLGYLPGSDKTFRTEAQITLRAIEQILCRLKSGGIIIVCAYTGHDCGKEEGRIRKYLGSLSTKTYEISRTEMMNRTNAPVLYLIIKKEPDKKNV